MNLVHLNVAGGEGRGSMIVTVMEARKEHVLPASLIGTVQLRAFLKVRAFFSTLSHQLNHARIANHINTLAYSCRLSGPSPSNAMECKVFMPDEALWPTAEAIHTRGSKNNIRVVARTDFGLVIVCYTGRGGKRTLLSCPLLKYSKRTSGHPKSFFYLSRIHNPLFSWEFKYNSSAGERIITESGYRRLLKRLAHETEHKVALLVACYL
jgi:hypothetical protein